ncbi:hypothetical protein BKA82DRAFT_4176999 [Pisolithus tinctorius]|nr:hypothetical protein BKA82DRAFT_4176999 [Pisolithus tinctorius]
MNTSDFFKAVVTPKLRSLDCTVSLEDLLSTLFSTLEGKFSSVEQVSFIIGSGGLDALAVCKMLPNVCHAEFYSKHSPSFFDLYEDTETYQSPRKVLKVWHSVAWAPIGGWNHLFEKSIPWWDGLRIDRANSYHVSASKGSLSRGKRHHIVVIRFRT